MVHIFLIMRIIIKTYMIVTIQRTQNYYNISIEEFIFLR